MRNMLQCGKWIVVEQVIEGKLSSFHACMLYTLVSIVLGDAIDDRINIGRMPALEHLLSSDSMQTSEYKLRDYDMLALKGHLSSGGTETPWFVK